MGNSLRGAQVLQKSQRRLSNGAVGMVCAYDVQRHYYGHSLPYSGSVQEVCQSTMLGFSMSYVTGTLTAYI